MESFFTRFRNPLVLIAVVLVQTIALAVQVQRPVQGVGGDHPDGAKTMLLRRWIVTLITPFEKISHGTGVNTRSLWSSYIDLRHTHEKNQELQQEVARLRREQAEFAEDAAQGRRLQALLGFKEQYITQTVAAQVIGTSGSDRSQTLWIDKGSAEGLKSGEAVITPDGVVGRLRDVFPHTAQLLLLNDPSSGAGVTLESTRIRGILRGTANGQIQINNLTADDRIKPGEKVLTSGGDQAFPRGLPVGVIESIAPDLQHQPYTAIMVKPTANLSRLEEVLVVTGTDATLSAPARADAAIADATAQDNKRAADLISEKLPGLRDNVSTDGTDKPAAADDATSGQSESKALPPPKPKPALHPDRYTPGQTPPAENLKPGAATTPQ
ncbi:MAG TPA: rod shape-determining protein MreC [Acidobacteriaceae bacterium]|jgi:rod shape-determining protein MreC